MLMKGCSERSRVWRGRVTVSVSLRAHLAADGGVCARRRVIQVQVQTIIRDNHCSAPRKSAQSDVTALFICTLENSLVGAGAR